MKPPLSIPEEMLKAKKLHGAGDYSGASWTYQLILEADPTHTEAQHFLGVALHQLGETEKADALLKETLVRQPGNSTWWANYGNVLTAQNKLAEAEAAFTRVVELLPQSADAWANLGSVLQRQDQIAQAEQAYGEALRLNPQFILGLKLLGTMLQQQKRVIEGAQYLAQAFILETDPVLQPLDVAKAWLILNQPAKAAEVYARVMKDQPDHPSASFLHAACTGINVPAGCTKTYVETTFDNYAPTFNEVQEKLAYRGPDMLGEILAEIALPTPPLDILDLGCGTGKCARILKPLSRTLTGVDLSQKMLDLATELRLYDQLIHDDLVDYLHAHPASYDLLVSAECFIYFGDMEKVFATMSTALRPGGMAIFTIESPTESSAPYHLHAVGRYCHSETYITSLSRAHHLQVIKVNPGILRMELCRPIHGAIWALRK